MFAVGKKVNAFNVARLVSALVCVVFALWSVLWLWAALLTVRAEKLITLWEQQPGDFNPQQAVQLTPRIKQSLLLNPLDANTHFLLARLYELVGNDDFAEEQYQIALYRQPSWDYAWAKLANFYSQMDVANKPEQEQLALQALMQAMALGPYELATQQVVIPLIFKYWQPIALAPNIESRALQILGHALQYDANADLTLNTAKQYKNLTILEPLLNNESQRNTLSRYQVELRQLDATHQ